MKKDRTIVAVIWEDAAVITEGWVSKEDEELCGRLNHHEMCATVGVLLHKTKRHIVVALTVDREKIAVNGTMKIPMKMVKRVVELGDVDDYLQEFSDKDAEKIVDVIRSKVEIKAEGNVEDKARETQQTYS